MGEDVWTVKRISAWIEGYLGEHGDDNARVSAQWLVSEALGMSRMQLFLDPERPLTPDERGVLRDWTRRRRRRAASVHNRRGRVSPYHLESARGRAHPPA